ncbi:MAG: SRPBCC domain-containing protein [Planctomycetes bacterium]|nr:SRPBCC domain-containing protein [Planctomycetota bacterium]MCC7169359.1 SRPBCC domain-containing protein [Planctomycetota bacterium]
MSARKHHGRIVDKEIAIRATPAQVYASFADARAIARWFVDAAEGVAKPGELVTWIFRDMNFRLPVPIIDAKPNTEFVTGGEIPGRLPALMEVFIRAADGGETRVRLVNSGFADGAQWDEEYQGVDSGWTMALATLKYALERHPDRDRTHVMSMQPATVDMTRLRSLYTTAAGLGAWLGSDVRIEGPSLGGGVAYSLNTRALGPMSGRVLADTGRELLLEWKEQDAVLGLKVFAAGPARMICLDFSTWKPSPTFLTQGALDGMLAALARALA